MDSEVLTHSPRHSKERASAQDDLVGHTEDDLQAVVPNPPMPCEPLSIRRDDIKKDIDAVLWSMKLQKVRRFFHQRFWVQETQDAQYASRLEPFPRLESVAEHSWHVADTVLLLAGHFPDLNAEHCVTLAVLHDKMEISIGDYNPLGRDGTGMKSHAFNLVRQQSKDMEEQAAIRAYLTRLRTSARPVQEAALNELLEGSTNAARFVKAVDKLQALAFVILKKQGRLEDRHLDFTLRYSRKTLNYYRGLALHYEELRSRLLTQVARRRAVTVRQLLQTLPEEQLHLPMKG